MRLEDLFEDCIVTHLVKGGEYQYLGPVKIKNTEWITGISYRGLEENSSVYVRPTQDFLDKFKLWEGDM